VDVAGPPVQLGARAALSFALLVHELMTNAVKYGALSNEDGRVRVGWAITDEGGEPTLHVRWREEGGPPVEEPSARGFGSKLIQLGLVGTGGVSTRYPRSGFEADMAASIDHLALA
jgi:two-component sensor histidine kinase